MLLSIVTLNYKKKDLTIACMQSLYKQFASLFEKNQLELIIVDNDSQDDSVPVLKKAIIENKYKNITVIANATNAGFGTGCNVGANAAKGEFILFQNNDTVVEDDGIWKMAEYLSANPQISILGGQLRNFDGSPQASSGKFYTLFNAGLLLLGGQRFGLVDASPTSIVPVDWVKGALMMIRKKAFEKLGGFDEQIFMYTEDMELCYRAQKMGMKIYFYPDVLVKHKDQGSTNKTFAIVNIYKNLLYFYKKHRSVSEYQTLKAMLVTKGKVSITLGKLLNKPYLVETYTKALEEL